MVNDHWRLNESSVDVQPSRYSLADDDDDNNDVESAQYFSSAEIIHKARRDWPVRARMWIYMERMRALHVDQVAPNIGQVGEPEAQALHLVRRHNKH